MRRFGRTTVISALGVVEILNWGSSFYLPTVLAGPIADETGWPLAGVVAGLSLGLLTAGAASPAIGGLIQHHGGRPVMAGGSVLLAAGLAGIALAPNLALFLAGWLVIGLGIGAGLYDASFATLTRLYGETARGAITALTLWGGLASTFCWPLSAWLLAEFGWRGACLVYAAIHLVLMLPLILVVVPPAAPVAAEAGGTTGRATLLTDPGEVRAFRLVVAIAFTSGLITSLLAIHILTLLQGRGFSLAAAVALGALIGPAQVAGRIAEMASGGRHHPIWTMIGAVSLTATGIGVLAAGAPGLALALALYGAGNGIFSIARGTLPLALFGPARYARVMGRIAFPALVAQAAAPALGALVIGRIGTDATFGVLTGLAFLNVALVAVLKVTLRR